MKTLSEKELNEIASKDRTWSFKIARDVQSALVVLNSEDDWDYISTAEDRAKFAPKLATDEFWSETTKAWVPVDERGFTPGKYRRRKKPVAGGEWRLAIQGVAQTDWPIVCILANMAGLIHERDKALSKVERLLKIIHKQKVSIIRLKQFNL